MLCAIFASQYYQLSEHFNGVVLFVQLLQQDIGLALLYGGSKAVSIIRCFFEFCKHI